MLQLRRKIVLVSYLIPLIFLFNSAAYADTPSIPITIGPSSENIVFDGKWSFTQEWKATSLTTLETENGPIYIRTAHWNEFIYVMIDAVADRTIDKGKDKAIVCFDSDIKKDITDENNYCFSVKLGEDKIITLRDFGKVGFEIVENPEGLIGVARSSDENDRYTKIPHSSYEFKIPIEPLERKDAYGFYVGIYDESSSKSFSWPPEIETNLLSNIPSPQKWGIIWSPDKSLPEFELPLVTMIFGIVVIIFISNKIVRLNSLFRF